tara:strand:- start:254 stop:946 length:693 start_codon:yes stop_codon:yes gene_type:complete
MSILIKSILFRIKLLLLSKKEISQINYIINSNINLNDLVQWSKSNFRVPTPQFIKNSVFFRYTDESTVWVETGTYKGTSTEFFSKYSKFVHTIEPEFKLFSTTKSELNNKGYTNINFYNGTSEEMLDKVLNDIQCEKLSIWLDGHWSGGDTFLGEKPTPVLEELKIIKKYLQKFKQISILIDDIRDFNNYDRQSNNNYPEKNILIKWGLDNKFSWEINYDILIFTNTPNR